MVGVIYKYICTGEAKKDDGRATERQRERERESVVKDMDKLRVMD
jgi:hypothetical protein